MPDLVCSTVPIAGHAHKVTTRLQPGYQASNFLSWIIYLYVHTQTVFLAKQKKASKPRLSATLVLSCIYTWLHVQL